MINYSAFLSQSGLALQESAIRTMGTVLAQIPDVVSFAPGYPDESMFPWEEFRDIAAHLLSGTDGAVLQYGPTRGYKPLLDALLTIAGTRGIAVKPDEVLTTTGSQQGLDLVARVLIDPGDVVLVELPSYAGAITAFRNAQAVLAGVKQEADGVDLEDLERVLTAKRAHGGRVRFLYVVPNFQNPTGLLIGRRKRLQLLEWAARHDLLIVEDDPYGELYFDDAASPDDTRPIKADDADGRVVY